MFFYLTMSTEEAASLPFHPSPALLRHIREKKSEEKQNESRAAYALLERLCLSHTCMFPSLPMPPLLSLDFLPSGKPILAGGISVSLSHAGGVVAAAISDTSVGIDIEEARPSERLPALARRFFSVRDAESITCLYEGGKEEEAVSRFYRLFTAKEAYLKCKNTTFPTAMKLAYPPSGCRLTYEELCLDDRPYALTVCEE